MPQYLISVWHDDDYSDLDKTMDPADLQRLGSQVGAVNEELMATGAWVFGAGLQPASTATVLRSAAGEVSMTDGPYAETKEQMGGFWVVEAADFVGGDHVELAHQVREEEDGALQDADQEHVPAGVVPGDLLGQLAHPVRQVVRLDEDLADVRVHHRPAAYLRA